MSNSNDRLTILFLTYNRMQYADPCLRAVIEKVKWHGSLNVHIADDGSPNGYVDRLRALAGGFPQVATVGASNSAHRGYGANFNLATQCVHIGGGVVLVVEDDWRLTRELDVGALALVLDENPLIGCIRLGYLGATQDLFGSFVRRSGQPLWLLDPESPEPHVWAGHPRLETVEWQREQGPWVEGLDPNQTEFAMSGRQRWGIAWPAWLHPDGGLFEHIGSERAR